MCLTSCWRQQGRSVLLWMVPKVIFLPEEVVQPQAQAAQQTVPARDRLGQATSGGPWLLWMTLCFYSWASVKKNLRVLKNFTELSGLREIPSKYHEFLINRKGIKYTINDCSAWYLEGGRILTDKTTKANFKPSHTYPLGIVDRCDKDICACLKDCLHLEPSMADVLCYASCKDESLGLLKMHNCLDKYTRAMAHATIRLQKV